MRGFFKRLFGNSPSTEDSAALYQSAMNLFKSDRFQEALDAFEKLAVVDSSSAPVHFMLGTTYTRLGGQRCNDDDSLVPWIKKAVAAFKLASDLADQHGGLKAEQRKIAAEAALHGERVIERYSPSLPEERRRTIYGDLMETIDSELLLGTNLASDFEQASRAASPKMMADSLRRNAALAEDAALEKTTARHGITKGQALAIKEEGREKKWPIKAITPELFNSRLLAAVRKGDSSEVGQLLEAGAKADSVDDNGESAIFVASTNGNTESVDLLLGAGADVNVDRGDQVFPLHRAAMGGFCETVRSLLRGGADVNVANRYRITPLHSASFEGHSDVVELLLQAGAFVDARNTGNETPLHTAIRHGHAQAAIRLIEAGADVKRTCGGGMSPLHLACYSGLEEVVERLIDAGVDVNLGDDHGQTPLHSASENGFTRIVVRLLKAGAHINATYCEATPLFCAAEEGHVEVVELLLGAGADRTIAQDGKTPEDIATEAGHDAVVKALANKGIGEQWNRKLP